jgi:hypothetical protein
MRLVGVCLFKVKRQLLALIFAPLHLEILEEREREGGGVFLEGWRLEVRTFKRVIHDALISFYFHVLSFFTSCSASV